MTIYNYCLILMCESNQIHTNHYVTVTQLGGIMMICHCEFISLSL